MSIDTGIELLQVEQQNMKGLYIGGDAMSLAGKKQLPTQLPGIEGNIFRANLQEVLGVRKDAFTGAVVNNALCTNGTAVCEDSPKAYLEDTEGKVPTTYEPDIVLTMQQGNRAIVHFFEQGIPKIDSRTDKTHAEYIKHSTNAINFKQEDRIGQSKKTPAMSDVNLANEPQVIPNVNISSTLPAYVVHESAIFTQNISTTKDANKDTNKSTSFISCVTVSEGSVSDGKYFYANSMHTGVDTANKILVPGGQKNKPQDADLISNEVYHSIQSEEDTANDLISAESENILKKPNPISLDAHTQNFSPVSAKDILTAKYAQERTENPVQHIVAKYPVIGTGQVDKTDPKLVAAGKPVIRTHPISISIADNREYGFMNANTTEMNSVPMTLLSANAQGALMKPDMSSTLLPAVAHEPFAALDSENHAAAPVWAHIGSSRAEAGYEDPVLGWVSVRADAGNDGIHAELISGSAESAQVLGSHLAGLNAYLENRHATVETLTVSTQEGRWDNGSSGADARQESDQAANRSHVNENHRQMVGFVSPTAEILKVQTNVTTGKIGVGGVYISVVA